MRKSRKIRLYPDARQRSELRCWFGAARYAYNQTVELLSGDDPPKAVKTKVRDIVLPMLPPWHRSAPREVLVGAIFDACRAVSAVKKLNAQLAKDKNRGMRQDEDFARVRFRSRKNPRQTFTVQANCVTPQGVYRTKLGDMLMAERLPVAVNRNICRLTFRHGQYHLAVPYDEEWPPERENQARVVALDPGVRSFLTWYCAESVGKIGEGAFFRIQRLCEGLDDLLSRAAKVPARKRRNMRRAAGRMRVKIENLISELHRKVARFLVDEFDVILLPCVRQRAMIAMALSSNPTLLIADEPTTSLDVTTQAQILELMASLQRELGMAMMLITHNLGVVAQMAEEMIVMYLGKIVERADTATLFRDPKHPYTQELLKSIPQMRRERQTNRLTAISGTVPPPFIRPPGCPFHPRCPQALPGVCDVVEPQTIQMDENHTVRCLLYDDEAKAVASGADTQGGQD